MHELELSGELNRVRAALGDAFDDESCCVTVVASRPAEDVLTHFLGDDLARAMELSEAIESGSPFLAVVSCGGAAVVIEPNGFRGSAPELLCELSASTRVASVYWSIDLDTRLSLAEDGRVLFSEDVLVDAESVDELPAGLAAELDFDADWMASSFLAAERFVGVALTPDSIGQIQAYAAPEPLLPLHTTAEPIPRRLSAEEIAAIKLGVYSEHWPLGLEALGAESAKALTAAVLVADDASRRRLALRAARVVLEVTDLAAELSGALPSSEASSEPVVFSKDMDRRVKQLLKHPDGEPTPVTYNVGAALRATTGEDAIGAALDATWWTADALAMRAPHRLQGFLRDAFAALGQAVD